MKDSVSTCLPSYHISMSSLEQRIKQQAHALGFELAGIAAATAADSFDRLRTWLDRGFAGHMDYMHRQAEARRHPCAILPEVRSMVMVAMNYKPKDTEQETETDEQSGKVARYARGMDYHLVLRERLHRLLTWLQEEVPGCQGRGVVDTAPLLERDFARRAGLGWIGKNTMLLNKRLGSYLFLGALLLDLELRPDPVHETSHCGTCTACLDACPTQAFAGPGVLDARRCLSYLTIELKTSVPGEMRDSIQDWLFGCDICQDVCPWNRKSPSANAANSLVAQPDRLCYEPSPGLEYVDLLQLLVLSEEEFSRRFHGTALMRAGRRGLLRNAALILGNRGDQTALPALHKGLADVDPVVRDAAQWAIDRIRAIQ